MCARKGLMAAITNNLQNLIEYKKKCVRNSSGNKLQASTLKTVSIVQDQWIKKKKKKKIILHL